MIMIISLVIIQYGTKWFPISVFHPAHIRMIPERFGSTQKRRIGMIFIHWEATRQVMFLPLGWEQMSMRYTIIIIKHRDNIPNKSRIMPQVLITGVYRQILPRCIIKDF